MGSTALQSASARRLETPKGVWKPHERVAHSRGEAYAAEQEVTEGRQTHAVTRKYYPVTSSLSLPAPSRRQGLPKEWVILKIRSEKASGVHVTYALRVSGPTLV